MSRVLSTESSVEYSKLLFAVHPCKLTTQRGREAPIILLFSFFPPCFQLKSFIDKGHQENFLKSSKCISHFDISMETFTTLCSTICSLNPLSSWETAFCQEKWIGLYYCWQHTQNKQCLALSFECVYPTFSSERKRSHNMEKGCWIPVSGLGLPRAAELPSTIPLCRWLNHSADSWSLTLVW